MTAAARVDPVAFRNDQGHQLFGMLHVPAGARRDVAVVLLSPGVKGRVAPHRLYNKLASVLAAEGFTVLRFDFWGLGDSEGSASEAQLQDLYGAIQVGRYIADTRAAVNWLEKTHGFRRVVLGGLCGGALTGLLEAQDDARVAGLLGLGLPVILQGTNFDFRRYLTRGQADYVRKGYLRRLLNPQSWMRLLTLQSDFRLLLGSFLPRRAAASSAALEETVDNTNPLIAPALLRVLARSCRVLLMFGESDRLHWDFQEKYYARHERSLAQYRAFLDIESVPEANHILTFTEWQHAFLARSRSWLLSNFGSTQATGERAIA